MEFNNLYPLHKACKDGDLQTAAMLLNTSDKLNLLSEDHFKNWTPIHWAAYGGHLDCLRQVVSYEPSTVNIQSSKTFQTPLHCAAEAGQVHCILWLLQAGANPDVKDNFGETALHKASRIGSAECVGILISTMSNICIQNSSGQTASMIADISGYSDIATFIRQKEMTCINVFQNRMGPLPLGPRLNRKRTRETDFDCLTFKRQRSIDLNESAVLPPTTLSVNLMSSVMDHQDLCGSELQYTNYMFESMLRECHGC